MSETDPLESIVTGTIKAIIDKGEEKIIDILTYIKSVKRIYGSLPDYANEMFGRNDEIKNIKKLLNKNKHVLVYGEHGIGKTRLSAKVCEEFKKKPVLWYSVGYETASSSKICGKILLELFLIDIPKKERIERILFDNLSSKQIKAIFLDNIDSIHVIRRFLSICNTLKIPLLVTSHRGNINGSLGSNQKFEITKLEKKYGIELFKDHLPLEFIIIKNEEKFIEKICKILDYHPFDIIITACNMKYFSTLSELKEKLESKKTAFSILTQSNDIKTYPGHRFSLELTYENLDILDKELFLLTASYPAKSVSYSLLSNMNPNISTNIKNIMDVCLIIFNRNNKRYEVHYFTHLFAINRLFSSDNPSNLEIKNKIINSLKDYLKANSDWDNNIHRQNIIEEIDNILGVMEWCSQSEDWENLIEFENIMRHYLYVLGEWDERIKWSQKVWNLRNNKMLMEKSVHNIIMAGVEGLCFVYLHRGNDEKVYKILNDVEKFRPSNAEDKNWQRIWCYYYRIKGMSALKKHSFDESKNEFEKAIILAKKSHWESMEIPIGIQLGIPLFFQKKYDESINILNNCINLAHTYFNRKPSETPPYRRIIRALIWLGKCYFEQKMFTEAREKFIEARKLYESQKLNEPLLISDVFFEWGLLEIESNERKKARSLLAKIDDSIDYYWSVEKLENLAEIKNELKI